MQQIETIPISCKHFLDYWKKPQTNQNRTKTATVQHFGLNQVLLFLILDVGTQVNKHFLIHNENAPQHTDIVWKGLVLQTRTWKWTAVIVFAISCISNSSSNSNNSSNNVIIAINNSSGINNSASQRKKDRHSSKVERWREVERLIKCCETDHWMKKKKHTSSHSLLRKRKLKLSPIQLFTPVYYFTKLVLVLYQLPLCFWVPSSLY